MRTPKILSTAVAIGAGALAAAGPAAAAPAAPLAAESQPFPVTASQGVVAWSSWDAQARLYRLVTLLPDSQATSERTVLPIPGSREPFDVDLGTDRKGRPVAVYSRYTDGAQQDLYRYSFASKKETLLKGLSRPDTDERQPTVWRGDIAFVRASAHTTRIMLGNTTRAGAPRTVVSRRLREGTFSQPELIIGRGQRRLAYVVSSLGSHGFGREAVHVRTVRSGHDRVIHVAQSGGANAARVTAPSWSDDGRALYFARTNQGSGQGNRYVRYLTLSARLGYARGRSDVFSTAWLGGVHSGGLLVSSPGFANEPGSGPDAFKLRFTGPLTFSARP